MKELAIHHGRSEELYMLHDKAMLQVDGSGKFEIQASLDGEHWSVHKSIAADCKQHSRTVVVDLLAGVKVRVVCVAGHMEAVRYSFSEGVLPDEIIDSEHNRVVAESARIEAEQSREVAEQQRESAERARVQAEDSREQAEAQRVSTFTANEQQREATFVANEEQRQQTFDNINIERGNIRISGYVDTVAQLPTDKAIGTVYGVKDSTFTEESPKYRVYVYTSNGWVDNGLFGGISAGVVQETGDGENVVMSQKAVSENFVNKKDVVNDLTTGGADKALSAEMGKELNGEVDKNFQRIFPKEFFGNVLDKTGFYNVGLLEVGSKMPQNPQSSSTKCYAIFQVFPNTKINLKTYLTSSSSGAVRPYVICNNSNIITQLPEKLHTYDYTQGVALQVEEESILYVACNVESQSYFYLSMQSKKTVSDEIETVKVELENTDKRFELVEDRLNEVSDERLLYTKYDATASSSYYNFQGIEVGSNYTGATRSTTDMTYYTLELQVKKGYKATIKTYTTSGVAGLVRGYCLTNSDNIVVDIAEAKSPLDFLSGKELYIESDGTLYVTCKDGYQDQFSVEVLVAESDISKRIKDLEISISESAYTKMFGLYLPHNKVLLNGASFSQYNGYFELAMKKLGLTGTNESVAGTNIFKLANNLYNKPSYYNTYDAMIIGHVHNHDVFSLPKNLENYTPTQYEEDSIIGEFIKKTTYVSQNGGFENTTYTDDELYAIGYDYCIKKYIELCYNLKGQEGYDDLIGKPVQIILYTHWHDARVVYNESVRRLANKWGFPLVKEDENIGFSKDKVHPIANKQQSVLYCNGVPWSSKTEVIDGVTYGFHPSGIASENWSTFVQSNEEGMVDMLPYIQIKRAAILVDAFSNKF